MHGHLLSEGKSQTTKALRTAIKEFHSSIGWDDKVINVEIVYKITTSKVKRTFFKLSCPECDVSYDAVWDGPKPYGLVANYRKHLLINHFRIKL